jgi:hypothetical protein
MAAISDQSLRTTHRVVRTTRTDTIERDRPCRCMRLATKSAISSQRDHHPPAGLNADNITARIQMRSKTSTQSKVCRSISSKRQPDNRETSFKHAKESIY